MSESKESVRVGDPTTTPPPTTPPTTTPPGAASVRELLAELAELEDATRAPGGFPHPAGAGRSTDLLAALAREQAIIDELHRRCPDAHLPTSPLDVQGPAVGAD